MYALNGRVGLVTGGGGGIGREIARRLARDGMAVAVLDRDGAAAQAAAAEIGGLAVTADVTSQEEVGRAVEATLARFEKIDLLVNNAGIAWMGPALEMPLEALQAMLRVNVEGVFIVSRAVLPHMIGRRSGSVVNLASWAGKTGPAFFAGNSAATGCPKPPSGKSRSRSGASRCPMTWRASRPFSPRTNRPTLPVNRSTS